MGRVPRAAKSGEIRSSAPAGMADAFRWRLNQYSGEPGVAYNLELAALWVAGVARWSFRLKRLFRRPPVATLRLIRILHPSIGSFHETFLGSSGDGLLCA